VGRSRISFAGLSLGSLNFGPAVEPVEGAIGGEVFDPRNRRERKLIENRER